MPRPVLPWLSAFRRVQMCMRVEFHQRKNGLSAFFASAMKRRASRVNFSSKVSMRLLFISPVGSVIWVMFVFAKAVVETRGACNLTILWYLLSFCDVYLPH